MKAGFALCLAALFVLIIPVAGAQSAAPQTYTAIAEATVPTGEKITFTIHRDGSKERIETNFNGAGGNASLYDFEAHKVYWIGWSGPGSCSAGRYLSKRAPVNYDPITASLENLPKTKRTLIRAEAVNGIPARLEQVAPAKLSEKPTRVWLADPGNFVVKMDGMSKSGKPMTFFEVKQWSTNKPAAALFTPPAECLMTDSEMDDTGSIRGHAESNVSVEVSGEKKLEHR